MVIITNSINIPTGVFTTEDVLSVYNNDTVTRSITVSAGIELRLPGTTLTGTRSIPPRAIATMFFLNATTVIISGTGIN